MAFLLSIHAGLLAWQSYRYSPTIDEPGHMVAGLSHWKFGRFDLYRVNPPLVRMIATLPMLVVDPKTDWSAFTKAPYARPEFPIGYAFTTANGFDTFWYFTLARWACIPFSLIGGYYCYRWANDLYGSPAGLFALTLWCFCPNILGNGALITPDAPAAALGVPAAYYFWRWLRAPTWPSALIAGLTLGLAELTKSTWIILYVLYPLLWLTWRLTHRLPSPATLPGTFLNINPTPALTPPLPPSLPSPPSTLPPPRPSLLHLTTILLLSFYLLNLGYAFENSFQRLDKFVFISRTLGGPEAHKTPGNRFTDTWLAALPVPVPANYLIGLDVQRSDFEKGKWSYLRGEHKFGGWWYYYLYAMLVKMPVGTLALLTLTALRALFQVARFLASRALGSASRLNRDDSQRISWRDEFALLAPAVIVITLVSSQTGFNRYLRYVLPAFPFLFIWASRLAQFRSSPLPFDGGGAGNEGEAASVARQRPSRITRILVPLLLAATIASSLIVYPHCLSYFNELAGGPERGHCHLADGNIDWGQDLLELRHWSFAHPTARPLYLDYCGTRFLNPQISGIEYAPMPPPRIPRGRPAFEFFPQPGWYAISVHELHGQKHSAEQYAWLGSLIPVAQAGYSILIYHVPTQ